MSDDLTKKLEKTAVNVLLKKERKKENNFFFIADLPFCVGKYVALCVDCFFLVGT